MTLSPRFEEALLYAARLHASQLRKGGSIPYVAHLLGVASIALQYGANEDESIAALLHDAIEDQGGAATREEIRRRFGDGVVDIVNGCTDADSFPKPPWKRRKETYVAHIRNAPASVRLVSACDKLQNARAILADYRVLETHCGVVLVEGRTEPCGITARSYRRSVKPVQIPLSRNWTASSPRLNAWRPRSKSANSRANHRLHPDQIKKASRQCLSAVTPGQSSVRKGEAGSPVPL